jgi:hemerythrin-like domain-containing protein
VPAPGAVEFCNGEASRLRCCEAITPRRDALPAIGARGDRSRAICRWLRDRNLAPILRDAAVPRRTCVRVQGGSAHALASQPIEALRAWHDPRAGERGNSHLRHEACLDTSMKPVFRMSGVGLLVVLAVSQAQGQKKMTDQRPTTTFRAEHEGVKEHLRHVHAWAGSLAKQQPSEQRKTAQKVATFFERHIKPHAEWEEKHLYPVVDRLAGGGPNAFTSTMRYEHRVVGRWINELRAEADKPTIDATKFARRTDNLLGLLWAHFEEEEEVLLPFIDRGMSKTQFENEVRHGSGAH